MTSNAERGSLQDTRDADAFPNVEYLGETLADAEVLLCYAAENGVDVDPAWIAVVLGARVAADRKRWTVQTAENLIAALTALSAKLRPITPESLRLCADDAKAEKVTRVSKLLAVSLALVIVPFSLATFATSAISSALHQDVTTANALAVTLSNELPSPNDPQSHAVETPGDRKGFDSAHAHGASQKEVIQHLQEIAATTRSVYTRGKQLNFFIASRAAVPNDDLELPAGLPDLSLAAMQRIEAYQHVRSFAQTADSLVSVVYGAFAACVLPVLYAVLGACAYMLRRFEQQLEAKTLSDSDGHVARYVIAGIAGAVIGLFNNMNFGQSAPASVSPFAIAFLVGYAVDVFFAYLEGVIQSFSRPRPTAAGQASAPSSSERAEQRAKVSA